MVKFFSKKLWGIRGFTLIELLVVIAIIGVLASIVLASLNSARRKSRDARRITDIKQLQLALELYFDGEGNNYPTALAALATEGYIPTVPQDPLGGTGTCRPGYCYAYPSGTTRTTYHLGAQQEDAANVALNNDKDCDSSDNNPVCVSGVTYTGGFDGSGAGTNGDDATTPIYDVIP